MSTPINPHLPNSARPLLLWINEKAKESHGQRKNVSNDGPSSSSHDHSTNTINNDEKRRKSTENHHKERTLLTCVKRQRERTPWLEGKESEIKAKWPKNSVGQESHGGDRRKGSHLWRNVWNIACQDNDSIPRIGFRLVDHSRVGECKL